MDKNGKEQNADKMELLVKQCRKLAELMATVSKSGGTEAERRMFWSAYLRIYDQIRALTKKYRYLPKPPPCLLSPEQEENVRKRLRLEEIIDLATALSQDN